MKIGLLIYLANDRENNSKRPYAAVREIAQQAEADGFDSIWLADHLVYRDPGEPTRGIWESWTILAALAEATRRTELGTLVLCNSFRNPAILAKMATAADEVSAGRLILGIGAGWNEPEYQAYGLPFDHRVDRLEEALQILRPLLRDGHADFAGRYYQARDCDNVPLGPRPAGPPLMVGGEGPRLLKLTAQNADLWNAAYGPARDYGRAAGQNRGRVPRGRPRSGHAGRHGAHRPVVSRPAGGPAGVLGQAPDRHGAGDRGGHARLCRTWRGAHHVSVRALHPRSARG